jgi:hypothetical protein
MGLNPVSIENFPGLDTRTDPGDSRGALDLSNVTLEQGSVRTRDGSASFFTMGSRVIYASLFERGANAPHVIFGATGTPGSLTAVTSAGVSVASTAVASLTNPLAGVRIGTTANSYFYIANPNAATLTRWDGAAWTFPAVLPAGITNPYAISYSPTDNRLAVAFQSQLSFSDPGAPETFGANNFVKLTPGDSENINAMCVFNNQLFVFKTTKFFVFYGTSADPAGNPVFNYRTVDTGNGLWGGINGQAVAVGDDAVYFLGRDGIYRTTGSTPVKMSSPLDGVFGVAPINPFWQGGTFKSQSATFTTLLWFDGRLYVSLPMSTSVNTVFVYDRRLNSWSWWNLDARALASAGASAAVNDARRLVFQNGNNANTFRMDPTLSADAGSAIVSRYRLPFEDYGSPRRKRLRETIIEGTGTVTAQWSKDWGALTTGSSVVLGTSPAIATARQRLAMLGNSFSLQLGASSGAWSVNRVQANVSDALGGPEITV